MNFGLQTFTIRKAQKKSIRTAYMPLIELGIKSFEVARIDFNRQNAKELKALKDEYGIEIDEFDTDEFLEALCKAARALDVRGHLYDIDDEEYRFISEAGDSYYLNAKNIFFDDEEEE